MMLKMVLTLMFQGVFPCYLGFGMNPAVRGMNNTANMANTTAGQLGSSASAEGSELNPFFSQEMKAQHSLTPQQQDEMLTASESGAGGAFGGAEGQINANAARTGNATGVTKSLDEMARDKGKIAAGASEGIAAQDVAGAQQERQAGAQGMQGLYGTNVSGQLGAMKTGLEAEQASAAANPGWLKTTLDEAAKLGTAAGGVMTGVGAL